MSIQYAYVRLDNDKHGLVEKCREKMKIKANAQGYALKAAKEMIGCDALLYGRGDSLYIGFKEKPKMTDSERWWKKNGVDRHDGFWVLNPKVKTEQSKSLSTIRREYRDLLGDESSTTDIVRAKYPDLIGGICGSYGRGLRIADPAFAMTGDDIVGKLPMPKDISVVIPDDFKEITATEFNSYFSN